MRHLPSHPMLRRLAAIMVVASAPLLVIVASAAAQDWPQWRGPERDGVADEFEVPSAWPDTLRSHWSVAVGLGYASRCWSTIACTCSPAGRTTR